MEKNVVSVMMLILLLFGMLVFAFNVRHAKGEWIGTVYIRADGSIDPPTAPIERDGDIYTLFGNITINDPWGHGIVIERYNVTLDGANYTLQGICDILSNGIGIVLSGRNNVTIKNVNIKNFAYGILIDSSTYIDVNRNTIVGNCSQGTGIWLRGSNNVSISGNNIAQFSYGILLSRHPDTYIFSLSNSVVGNNITDGFEGITLSYSSNNNISRNNIANNWNGINLYYSSNNIVSENNITNNRGCGVRLESSSNNILRSNSMASTLNFGVYGTELADFVNDVDASNTVDRKPIYYWIMEINKTVPIDAGYVALVNCTRITVQNLNLTNNGQGILLVYTKNSTIIKNNIANNYYGIDLYSSSNNSIYHNNFMGCFAQVHSNASTNFWDDGYPSGGNYWYDYSCVDLFKGPYQNETGGDGISDTPYIIDADNVDHYPLMTPYGPWGDWNHYHNYTEIVSTLLYLNNTYPDVVDVFFIGKSWQNQDIYCIKLTNESNTHPKPKLLFVGYHHARELISAELPLYFAVEAATNFGTNETITHMLNYSEIYIIPALNPDGFEAVSQNEWQRKNTHPYDEDDDGLLDEDPPDDEDGDGYVEDLFFQNETHYWFIRWEGVDDDNDGLLNEDWVGGVDLNRNYGYQWDAQCQSGSPYPWAEDYRGPEPFSEPETQAIRDLAMTHNFKYAISFHSGTTLILYPWGYTNAPTPHDGLFKEIAGNLSNLIGAPYQQSAQLYTTSGVWDDWMYGNRSTYALTCEIYGNYSAWQYEPGPEPDTWWEKGVFQFFNPDPTQIETVIQRWLPVFTYMANRAITEAYNTATTDITPLKNVVGQGYTMNINVTVFNKGEFTETFSVTVYANTTAIATQILTLTSGDSANITLTWNTTGFSKGNYTIWAYAWPVPGETDTTDNTYADGTVTVTIPGDINGDFRCEGKDNALVAKAYDTRPGNPRWIANADINNDNRVEGKDVALIAKYYGTQDP